MPRRRTSDGARAMQVMEQTSDDCFATSSMELDSNTNETPDTFDTKRGCCCRSHRCCCEVATVLAALLFLALLSDRGSHVETLLIGFSSYVPPIPHLTLPPGQPRLRFVAISDTHNRHNDVVVPDGDVLVHAGDLTFGGTLGELRRFNDWLGTLPHRHKIVIGGNHDFALDRNVSDAAHWADLKNYRSGSDDRPPLYTGVDAAKRYLTNCTYLNGEALNVQGVNIYGVPEQLAIPFIHRMAFNVDSETEMATIFNHVPADTDVLLTHSPPYQVGRLDRTLYGQSVGSSSVAKAADHAGAKRLRWHVFGHIHESYGVSRHQQVTYINAAAVNLWYRYAHPPIVFDVPLLAANVGWTLAEV